MNDKQQFLDALCHRYELGNALSQPTPCTGGLLHRLWQFETTKGLFVIKELNPAVVNQTDKINRYRVTETIARQFQSYVPSVCALTYQNDPIFIFETKTIMVFPYIDGVIFPQNALTQKNVQLIGESLATIHKINVNVKNTPDVELLYLELPKLNDYKNQIAKCQQEVFIQLNQCMDTLIDILETHQQYESILKNNLITSHRDYDPKNVLWDKHHHFYIIDWESAGLINKTKDTLATAIYWSLDNQYHINATLLAKFLTSYQENGGVLNQSEIQAGLYGLLADWLNWLDFNLWRILNNAKNSEEFNLGEAEAKNTLKALPILFKQFPSIEKKIIHEQENL